MSNVAGAQAQAKKIRSSNLGRRGHPRQHRGSWQQCWQSGDAPIRACPRHRHRRSPADRRRHPTQSADRHRHWIGTRLPGRPHHWRERQASISALVVSSLFQTGSFALLLATAILLPALVAVPAMAAGRSASIEQAPSSWESLRHRPEASARAPKMWELRSSPTSACAFHRARSSKSNMSDYHVQ